MPARLGSACCERDCASVALTLWTSMYFATQRSIQFPSPLANASSWYEGATHFSMHDDVSLFGVAGGRTRCEESVGRQDCNNEPTLQGSAVHTHGGVSAKQPYFAKRSVRYLQRKMLEGRERGAQRCSSERQVGCNPPAPRSHAVVVS